MQIDVSQIITQQVFRIALLEKQNAILVEEVKRLTELLKDAKKD